MSGDIDFMNAALDLLPVRQPTKEVKDRKPEQARLPGQSDAELLYPPFDNLKVRRAALLARNRKDVTRRAGRQSQIYQICGAVFDCGSPSRNDAAAETLLKGQRMAAAKKALAEIGMTHGRRAAGRARCDP